MKTVKQTILTALEQYKGDDLARAEAAFKHKSQRELDKEYGQSGQTCREILKIYKEHEETVSNAIIWADNL